jgi:hypothetical protein
MSWPEPHTVTECIFYMKVVTGKLSLVNVTPDHDVETTPHHQYKFPIGNFTRELNYWKRN